MKIVLYFGEQRRNRASRTSASSGRLRVFIGFPAYMRLGYRLALGRALAIDHWGGGAVGSDIRSEIICAVGEQPQRIVAN